MAKYTYCWEIYGSMTIEARDREEADKKFDEIDMEDLRENEDDWELTLVQEERDDGKIIDHVM